MIQSHKITQSLVIQHSFSKTLKLHTQTDVHFAYNYGFSVGFDFKEVDYMITVGAKGKTAHKDKIRTMLTGIYDNETHFKDCQSARIAVISTSLKTAETGYISRRLAYHFDDVSLDTHGNCKDYQTMLLHYPSKIPTHLHHIKNIGLYLVTVIMPPLTQKMLDSFHAASAGEQIVNNTAYFDSLINCTHPELLHTYKTQGILATKKWLFQSFTNFFDTSIEPIWITLMCDFLCITGEPIGVCQSKLTLRINKYRSFTHPSDYNRVSIPVLKYCKFGNPYKNLIAFAHEQVYETLDTHHSCECFY